MVVTVCQDYFPIMTYSVNFRDETVLSAISLRVQWSQCTPVSLVHDAVG